MTDGKLEAEKLRAALLAADDTLFDAIDARTRAHKQLLALKEREPSAYVAVPRDHDVLGRALEHVRELPAEATRALMTELLSGCARLTAPIVVAYVGQEGGFGHVAARRQFGAAATLRAFERPEDALSEVERGHASFAVLPFETSHDGAVTSTVNLLARSDVKICAEIPVPRRFHLVSQSGERDRVQRIYAASNAVTACEQYLRARFPNAVLMDAPSAIAAAQHAKTDPETAALAPDFVAEAMGLHYVERAIEDVSDLRTRFVAVGNDVPPRTGHDRTALALALHDSPGVLIECLRPFSDRKINITRLETRPARGWEWRYLILIELDGHITDRPVLTAIEELRSASRYVRIIGSYPISEP